MVFFHIFFSQNTAIRVHWFQHFVRSYQYDKDEAFMRFYVGRTSIAGAGAGLCQFWPVKTIAG